jgi:predicted permease
MRNLRFAARLLARQPAFAVTAILSIAVGVGANTAIFTAVNTLLLAPPAGVTGYDRLVDIGRTRNGEGFDTVGYPTFLDVRERAHGFAGIAGYTLEPQPFSLAGDGGAERLFGVQVSGNYFEVAGVRPFLGRLFTPGDERPGVKNPIVVLSHAFWTSRFQGDRSIVGRAITLNGEPFEVAGVAPPGFTGTSVLQSDVFVPLTAMAPGLASEGLLSGRSNTWMVMIGRLADGGTIEQAQSGLDAVMAQLRAEHPDTYEGRGLQARAASRVPGVSGMIGGFMAVLMALVGLVLLIACVNLAGMQLARAAARSREIAVRLALGASRRQIVGQLVLESLLLAAAGGALGFIIGQWMVRALWGVLPPLPFPLVLDFSPDLRVLAFTAAATMAAGVLTGLAPALQSTKPALVPALKDEGKAPARLRMRHLFVGGQLALSIVLLLAAMLLLRAFQSALDIDPGFDPAHVVSASLDLEIAGYTGETAQPFYRDLLERARAIPGASHAALAVQTPLNGSRFGMGRVRVPELPDEKQISPDWNLVSPGFFETLRMPMAEGRTFTEADRDGAQRVAIINERFAARAWPGQSAVGRRLLLGETEAVVVGVTRDARMHIIGNAPEPYLFVPLYQRPFLRADLLVRHDPALAPAAVVSTLRHAVRGANPYLPVVSTHTLSEVAAFGMVPQRLAATLAGTLGAAGLLLAAIGLYGVMSYAVAARTREIGIRQALGADAPRIVRMFVRQGMTLAAAGALAGLALGLAMAFAIQGVLFGVSPVDPAAIATTIGSMLIVAFGASYLPARRAAAVAPLAALRSE